MKVICAGFGKTGTKSLYAALHLLGYNTYDFLENATYLSEEWIKIFEHGWTTEDFRRMYKDVDAVTDYPAFYFWEEIHKAFPEAKVILMLREDEDAWCNSMEKQLRIMEGSFLLRLMQYLSPTARNTVAKVFPYLGSVVLGHTDSFHWKPFRWARINRELLKLKFRAHNAYVVQNVRPEKFLQFKCSDGWEPLCKFLDVAIPDETFPHENKSGEILQKLLETNPHLMKMKREVLMSSAIITLTTGIAGYFLFTRGPRNIYHSVTSWMKTLPEILHTRT